MCPLCRPALKFPNFTKIFLLSLFGSSFAQISRRDILISPNQNLTANQCIYSSNDLYSLCYQNDAHLVGYDCTGKPFWANSPYNYSPGYCIMQGDGNFVCYDSKRQAKWATGTAGRGVAPYRLIMQSDRNVVIYDSKNTATWASNTWVSASQSSSLVCLTATPTSSPTSYPSSILPTYPFTKSPTTTPSISTPSAVPSFSITASPSSAPTIIPYTALFVSKYLSFSGENFFAYSSLAQVLNSTFSFSAWITTNSHPASIVSLGRSSSSSIASNRGGEFILDINSNGKLRFKDFSPTTGPGFSVQGGNVVNSAGSRVHVAVSRNGLDCSLYINGQPSGRSISAVSVAYKNAFLVFGVDYRNNSNYFKGTMDHIAIYSQSLSDSEINALYNAEVGAPTPSPSNAAGSGSSGGGGPIQSNSKCDVTCIISIACTLGVLVVVVACAFVAYRISKTSYSTPHGNLSAAEEGAVPPTAPSCVHIYCPVPEPEPVLTMPNLCPVPEPERVVPDPPSPPPDEFLCPISFEIMTDPVITAAGFTYERAEIEHWFRDNNTDPQARSSDINKTLTPNIQLRQAIERYTQARRS